MLRRLPPHIQEQVRTVVAAGGRPVRQRPDRAPRRTPKASSASQVRALTEYLLSDDELRGRCGDLLARPKHLDRVLREATTLLENRIRQLSGLGGLNPEALVNRALNADLSQAVLQVSAEANEQAGFHSICRGMVLAFRHRAHHQLDDKVTPEQALRICAFVDALLDILRKATRRPGA
jgi:Protein of unknown function (Hypoth_ymh)